MVQDMDRIETLRRAIAASVAIVAQADALECHSAAALIETAVDHMRQDLERAEQATDPSPRNPDRPDHSADT